MAQNEHLKIQDGGTTRKRGKKHLKIAGEVI